MVSQQSKEPQLTPEELEARRQRWMLQIQEPSGPAIPKEPGLGHLGLMQPLPNVSYLATSPTYYEMMARTRKKKPMKGSSTRRQITENRITQNIMSYN